MITCTKLIRKMFNLPALNPLQLPLIYLNGSVTWWDAELYCYIYYWEMAVARNMAEVEAIQQIIPANTEVWIGLTREVWGRWSDGRLVYFNNWLSGIAPKQNDNCAVSVFNSTAQGKFLGRNCDDKLPFVCTTISEYI